MAESVKTLLVVFPTVAAASTAVSGIIGRRIIPAALEMMDNLCIQAVESRAKVGFPMDAEAVLIVEVEGLAEEIETMAEEIDAVCRGYDALDIRIAKDEAERARLWAARKGAFGAIGAITPDYYTVDGVVPRSKLPEVLAEIGEIAEAVRPADRQRLPRRRRQPPPADPLRRRRPRRDRADRRGGRRDHAALRRGRRLALRRARHRDGEEGPDAADLLRGRRRRSCSRSSAALDPAGHCNPDKVFPTPGRCLEMFSRKGSPIGW